MKMRIPFGDISYYKLIYDIYVNETITPRISSIDSKKIQQHLQSKQTHHRILRKTSVAKSFLKNFVTTVSLELVRLILEQPFRRNQCFMSQVHINSSLLVFRVFLVKYKNFLFKISFPSCGVVIIWFVR